MKDNDSYVASNVGSSIRKLRKKLRQIEKLERMERELTLEEEDKVHARDELRSELKELLKVEEENMVALTKESASIPVNEDKELKVDYNSVDHVFDGKHHVISTDEAHQTHHFNGVGNDSSTSRIIAELQEKDGVNGIHEIGLSGDMLLDEEENNAVTATKDETETDVPKTSSDAGLTITRKSLRERKPRDRVQVVKKAAPSITSGQLFEDLNLKMSLLEGHHHDTRAIDLYENFVVSGGRDTSLKLWFASSQEELKSLGGHDGTITGVCFMKDKRFTTYPNVVTASYDCSLRIWDLENGAVLKSIYVYSPVTCLDYSDGFAAIGTEGGKIELYDVDSGEQMFSVNAHDDVVSAVKILADRRIVSGSSDGVLKIYDSKNDDRSPIFVLDPTKVKIKSAIETVETDGMVKPLTLHMSKINCISTWNDVIIYGDEGYNLKILNYQKGEITKVRNNLKEFCPTQALAVAQIQGRAYLFSVGSDVDDGDGYVNVRSLPDLRYLGTIQDLNSNSGPIESFCIQQVDDRIRFITGGIQLRVWDQVIRRGRKRKSSPGDDSLIPCKFICNYTEARESEPETDSEDESQASQESSKDESVKDTESSQRSWCVIL